ncbi:cytochrome P450 [Streptomyces orinoci]|uniref:Cytochrome P450 n=1 Tax=Streptomyces orinoci TaxID=67339 RepID=A0ABV3JT55_STRON|nr:cytochrome P450 [Streptomyces orinoci]
MTPEETVTDLTDPRTFDEQDLAGYWRRLRAEEPVHWHPPAPGRPGFWVVSRHADILPVYRDNETFTSERGNVLTTLLSGGDSAAGHMLPVTDGHRHRELRKIILRAFAPRTLDRVAATVRANTRALVAAAVELGTCDFATDIADRIPMGTICDLLGVPTADRPFLLDLTHHALSSDTKGADEREAVGARNEILLYFGELLEQRRAAPGEDVISMLAHSEIDGRPLPEDDIVLNCYSLIIGGDETSRLSMIEAAAALARHGEQWQRLRDGRVDPATAVEEVLRWASPTLHFGRTCTRPARIAGTPIAEGDIVTLWHCSANRDETVFADPHAFRLDRTPNKHLAFGHGPHFCLGAYLARVEIGALLTALRDFADDLEVTGEARRIHSAFLTGYSSLPVRFQRKAATGTRL